MRSAANRQIFFVADGDGKFELSKRQQSLR
jgi:hypothetical protein